VKSVVRAIAAGSANLDHRARCRKSGPLGGSADALGQAVVVNVNRLAAGIADQEDAIVKACRMLVRDLSIRALDPAGEVCANEKVEDPIDAVGGNAAPL